MQERNHFYKNCLKLILLLTFLCFSLLQLQCSTDSFNTTIPTIVDSRYEIKILVPGSHFHGVQGLTFDSNDNLYVGSVAGMAIYNVDTNTGEVREYIGPPLGEADDLEFGPDGRIYYTSFFSGKLHCKSADGDVIELADNLPGINSLAFNNEGRLFAAQCYLGDALYEIDLSGEKKTRKIIDKPGTLNGFDFGPDNKIYGPIQSKGTICKIDVETGIIEVVAEGFNPYRMPAVNFDTKGNLFAVDNSKGEVFQIDINSGEKKVIANVSQGGFDNLAIDSKDRIFITIAHSNGIYEIDKKTGKFRTVVEGEIACASGVAVVTDTEGDMVYVTDIFTLKRVNALTGEVNILVSGLMSYSVSANDNTLVWTRLGFTGAGTIQVYDRSTDELINSFSGFNAPSHALMMDDGSLIVAEITTGNLLRVTGEEEEERTVIAENLDTPVFLAMSENDAVYVAEAASGTISRINLNTGDRIVIASGLKMPEGIGVLPDGKLVVAETGKKRLVQIDPVSGAITAIAINLPVGYPKPPSLPHSLITGVAVSNSGSIYVTSDIENSLYKIMPQ
ncbi:DUF6923 family protein [Candidatus Latescibacterota bacterium]